MSAGGGGGGRGERRRKKCEREGAGIDGARREDRVGERETYKLESSSS